MKKEYIIGLIILVLLILVVVVFVSSSQLEESKIKAEIDKANYCEIDSDCIDAGSKCPFGCSAYVNKNEVERISQMIDSFDSKCVYSCIFCPTVICENKTCREICE